MNSSQAVFEAQGGAPTQTDRFITCLMNANGHWVDLPTLVAFVGGYACHSRAADARKKGYNVENDVQFDPLTGKRHSFYRIVP